jgi:hypothetical protein
MVSLFDVGQFTSPEGLAYKRARPMNRPAEMRIRHPSGVSAHLFGFHGLRFARLCRALLARGYSPAPRWGVKAAQMVTGEVRMRE